MLMRGYCRISLRGLVLIAPVIVGLGLVQIAEPIRKARELEKWNAATHHSIKEIEAAQGTVEVLPFTDHLGWGYRLARPTITDVYFTSVTHPKRRPFPRSEALYEALRTIPGPHGLVVSHTDFCTQDLERLQGAKFTRLRANSTLLSNDRLSGACSESLYSVHVGNTAVGDAFVQWISSHGNIAFCDLSGTKITDVCVPYLLKNSRLLELNVQNTQLSDNAIKMLIDAGTIRQLER